MIIIFQNKTPRGFGPLTKHTDKMNAAATNPNQRFEVGSIYEMRFIGDSDLKPAYICVKRTNKTASFERFQRPNDSLTRKILTHGEVEYVREGSYSMAPTIYASRLIG